MIFKSKQNMFKRPVS